MNTQYSEVIEIVLAIMESYEINDIEQYGEDLLEQFFLPYITIAAGELENRYSDIDLSKRNNTMSDFGCILTDGQKLIVAKYIVMGYLSRHTHDILQMRLHLQDGDFKTYAEKNNLDGKLNALYSLQESIDCDVKGRGYKNFEW